MLARTLSLYEIGKWRKLPGRRPPNRRLSKFSRNLRPRELGRRQNSGPRELFYPSTSYPSLKVIKYSHASFDDVIFDSKKGCSMEPIPNQNWNHTPVSLISLCLFKKHDKLLQSSVLNVTVLFQET